MVEPKRWRQRLWRGVTLLIAAAVGGAAAATKASSPIMAPLDRSGLYVAPALTWAKAASVRLDAGFNATVDGAVYSQPLYWVPPGGGAARIIVATEKNNVYALDAAHRRADMGEEPRDAGSALGAAVRQHQPDGRHRHADDRSDHRDRLSRSVRPDVHRRPAPHGVRPFARHGQRGAGLAGRRRERTCRAASFNNAPQGQRSALTLVNGKLYVPYAGHYGDCGTYNGMVVGLNLATPAVFGAWSTEITGGGSWGQSGVAFDGTSMFVTTGNTFSSSNSSWGGGEAVIRLPPTLTNPTQDADFFAPTNWQTLDAEDLDLGGTSAIPIDVPVTARVLALGKDGNAYLLNRENLGGIGAPNCHDSGVDHRIITAMATYPGADAARVAFVSEGQGSACPSGQSGNLVMLRVTPSAIATAWCASFNGSGAPIVTTTDGKTDPIVWVVGAQGDGKLYGFRGTDGKLLAAVAGGSAPISHSRPFCGPTAAFMWPPTARSTPSCIRASGGGSPYSCWPAGAVSSRPTACERNGTPLRELIDDANQGSRLIESRHSPRRRSCHASQAPAQWIILALAPARKRRGSNLSAPTR